MSDRETTKTLLDRLERHYIKPSGIGGFPGGVFIRECGINGPGATSRVDALYAGFTSTSGRLLIGHEVKASRADWRKELDSSGKADFWHDNVHAWYIVAPSTEIVRPEELPDGWGLMVLNTKTTTRMDVKVKARVDADRVPSWTATRSILSRLDTLRANHETELRSEIYQRVRKELEELFEKHEANRAPLTHEQRSRLNLLDRIETALGQKVVGYDWTRVEQLPPEKAAAAIRLIGAGHVMVTGERYSTQNLKRQAEAMLAGLNEWEQAQNALRELESAG